MKNLLFLLAFMLVSMFTITQEVEAQSWTDPVTVVSSECINGVNMVTFSRWTKLGEDLFTVAMGDCTESNRFYNNDMLIATLRIEQEWCGPCINFTQTCQGSMVVTDPFTGYESSVPVPVTQECGPSIVIIDASLKYHYPGCDREHARHEICNGIG